MVQILSGTAIKLSPAANSPITLAKRTGLSGDHRHRRRRKTLTIEENRFGRPCASVLRHVISTIVVGELAAAAPPPVSSLFAHKVERIHTHTKQGALVCNL